MPPKFRSRDVESHSDGSRGPSVHDGPYTFRERISHFTWSNFAVTMSTGAIAVLLSQQPFTFRGLDVIGKIFFILDLVLFISFCILMTMRFIWNPWKLTKSLHHPNEALFFGSAWVSLALIFNCTYQYGVPSCGPWLLTALEVVFWLYAGCALLVAVFQYSTLFVAEKMPVSSAMPAWVFPVYPFLVIGSWAATMLPSLAQDASWPIFIGGILFQGLGWIVAMLMYSIYVVRLLSNELPPAPTRPGMFISVGPAGYTSAALVALGNQAPSVIPPGFLNLGSFDTGAALKVIGVFSGIFIWLVAFWFFCLSLVAVITGARQMSFTLNWWAFIFPNVGLTLAAIQIANALESKPIQAVTSAMSILLVIAWFFVAINHILAISHKQVLWEGKDEDADMGDGSKSD